MAFGRHTESRAAVRHRGTAALPPRPRHRGTGAGRGLRIPTCPAPPRLGARAAAPPSAPRPARGSEACGGAAPGSVRCSSALSPCVPRCTAPPPRRRLVVSRSRSVPCRSSPSHWVRLCSWLWAEPSGAGGGRPWPS